MKKLLLLLCCSLIISKAKAQVVFCPPGAEWHYLFNYHWQQLGTLNETIKYIGDSIEGNDTLKILRHDKFFTQTNGSSIGFTLIKQKGDTVFMRNKETNHQWQVLYNFAAQPGQSWTNSFGSQNFISYTTTVVGSTTKIFANNVVKELSLSYNGLYTAKSYTHSGTISEYYGSNGFLFNYISKRSTDGDYLLAFLCYSDSLTGTHSFSDRPCDYSNLMGIHDQAQQPDVLKIFPNPSSSILTLEFENEEISSHSKLEIVNVLGEKVLAQEVTKVINIEGIETGIYFLRIFKNEKLIAMQKIIKE